MNRYRYIYICFLIFVGVSFDGIAQDSTVVSSPLQYRVPVETYVRSYVEPRLQTWLKWDRYEETTAQYKERTNEANRIAQIKKWENEALSIYKKKRQHTVQAN